MSSRVPPSLIYPYLMMACMELLTPLGVTNT